MNNSTKFPTTPLLFGLLAALLYFWPLIISSVDSLTDKPTAVANSVLGCNVHLAKDWYVVAVSGSTFGSWLAGDSPGTVMFMRVSLINPWGGEQLLLTRETPGVAAALVNQTEIQVERYSWGDAIVTKSANNQEGAREFGFFLGCDISFVGPPNALDKAVRSIKSLDDGRNGHP